MIKRITEKKKFEYKDKGSIKSKRAIHIAQDLSYNFGEDVVIYDVRNSSPFVSYYIVASSKNEKRLRALVSIAKETLYDNYKEIDHSEGKNDSQWILIDAKDVVVQLFTKEERERVQFDALYKDVPHKMIVQKEEPIYRRRKKAASQIWESEE